MNRHENGQTLIGVIIAIAVLAILGQALFTLTDTSYKFVTYNRARIAARHIAQEKIEAIRNVPYDEVGTSGGIPSGSFSQIDTVTRNGLTYTIRTTIVYIDDTFDGTAPSDLLPTDYKRARVSVSWDGLASSSSAPMVLVTDVAPRGIETTEGGGTLSILVFDANAEPVPQATVLIEADSTPAINLQVQTNDNGRIILPGAPTCIECYEISVTKDGYSVDKTYTVADVANPSKPPQSIIEGSVTEISFAIDELSTLEIASFNDRETGFTPRPNISFILHGDKIIGTNIDDLPVYKYYEIISTDETGVITVEDLEWDNYSLIFPDDASFVVSGINPLLPMQLLPNSESNLSFSLSENTENSFLGIYTYNSLPVASVSATLSDGTEFSESKFTGSQSDPDYGQVFFSSLDSKTYSLFSTASGFINDSVNVPIFGNTSVTTILIPQQ